jgi:Zn-dependent protease
MKLFGKIPVTVSTGFWVVAGIIGYLNTSELSGTLTWMTVIFLSVLIHELGHASLASLFGLTPRIELIAFGGLTHHFGRHISLFKQFLIVLAGPVFGFLLYLLAYFINAHVLFQVPLLAQFCLLLQMVNLYWTIFNILPILPLDGGQMLRLGLEAVFQVKGFSYALFFSILLSGVAALLFFLSRQLLLGSFFFLFAYQNFMDWKKVRQTLREDQTGELRKKFSEAETLLHSGNKEKALEEFEEILKNPSKGMISKLSAQYVAFLEYERGNVEKAYAILLPERKRLTHEGLYLLQKTAFEVQNYQLAAELAGSCFQSYPGVEVALRSSKAHALLGEAESCIGWLETALEQGLAFSFDLLSEPAFDLVRDKDPFKKWILARSS